MKKTILLAAILCPVLFLITWQIALGQQGQPEAGPKPSLSDPSGSTGPAAAESALIMADSPTPSNEFPLSTGFDYPVGGLNHEGYEMNNCFGCDYLDLWGHTGEDFDNGAEGGPVYSASEGVVVWTGWGPGAWGQVIIVRHIVKGMNFYSQYAHVRDIFVSPGQAVGRRQVIATVGTTGTTAPHLHFEIKDQPVIGHGYTGQGFSGLNVIQYEGVYYYAPSWFIDNLRYFWDDMPDTDPPAGRHYYWPWYDNVGGRNWVLMGSPAGGGQTLSFDINIRRKNPDLRQYAGSDTTDPGHVLAPVFPGLVGGPVIATSLNGGQALVSQRSLWAGNSLEEVPGVEESDLSDHFYWPWYDELSPGFRNWVVVGNPSQTETVNAEFVVRQHGGVEAQRFNYEIPPGAQVAPQFDRMMGGPLEVRTWVKGGLWANEGDHRPVVASQRLLINGVSFNEMPGLSALSDHYLWTWYDGAWPGVRNWILAANPSESETVTVRVSFTNMADGQPVAAEFDVEPGLSVTPEFPGKMGGPVEMRVKVQGGSWDVAGDRRPVIASQRILWGPSFEEVPGIAVEDLSDEYHWTWYDQASPGMTNWVMIANNNDFPVYYEIGVEGTDAGSLPGAQGTLAAGASVFPKFPGLMGGPVRVQAWTGPDHVTPADVVATQRVLYNGHFNELAGTVLD